MGDSKYVNVFVTSRNRQQDEKPCDWLLKFPSGMISAKANQGLKLNVVSYHIPNNFYNINERNNQFEVIIRDQNDEIDKRIQYTIEPGNYSVLTFCSYINNLCKPYFVLTYKNARNIYTIKSTYTDPSKTVFLKPISCGQFFGLNNVSDMDYELSTDGEEMDYTANMCSFDKVVVNAYGLNVEKASLENLGRADPDFERSSILLWCSRTDVPINAMIKYENYDGGNSYSYNLYDTDIHSFKLQLTDEYGNILESALDYTMLLRFEIYNKRNMYSQLDLIVDYLKSISYYLMMLLERFVLGSSK